VKISKPVFDFLFNLLVSMVMSAVLSGAMLAVNVGFVPAFAGMWARSFLVSLVFALPTTYVAIPLVTRVMQKSFTVVPAPN
jgi:hypothetical protein